MRDHANDMEPPSTAHSALLVTDCTTHAQDPGTGVDVNPGSEQSKDSRSEWHSHRCGDLARRAGGQVGGSVAAGDVGKIGGVVHVDREVDAIPLIVE